MKKKITEKEYEKLKKLYSYEKKKASIMEVVSRLLNSEYFDIEKLLDFIMELALKMIRVEAGSLLLIEGEELIFKIAKGEKADKIKSYTLKIGEGIAGYVAEKGKSEIVNNVKKDPRWKKEIAEAINFPTNSILCVPLVSKEKIIGVIEMINKKSGKFTKDDERLLKIFSSQVAIAIENSRLFQKAEEKIRNLTALSEVSAIITSSLELKEVLKSIMEMATKLMKAEASSLMLIDEKTQELVFEEALGEKEEKVKKIKLRIGEGIAGYVAKFGIPLLISDAYSDPRFNPEVDKFTGFRTKSILCVPLKIKDKIIGVVEVLNRIDKKSFDEDDKELFSALANHAAIAIENARLYKELRELFLGVVKSLAEAIDAKSAYTHGHSQRVSEYSLAVAQELNLNKEEQEIVEIAGILHDIGKIGIDEKILNKPGNLTQQEYEEIKKHSTIGAEIIEPVSALKEIVPAIKHHQERYDGSGYPDGLKGEKIPLIARILAVADAFDAMTSDRPYRKKLSDEVALSEIEKNKERQFDPEIVEAFFKAYKKGKIRKG